MANDSMQIAGIEFAIAGHNYQWRWLNESEGRGSLLCLNPSRDEQGVDQTDYPGDEEISKHVGRSVRFVDSGDHPDYPESIFQVQA